MRPSNRTFPLVCAFLIGTSLAAPAAPTTLRTTFDAADLVRRLEASRVGAGGGTSRLPHLTRIIRNGKDQGNGFCGLDSMRAVGGDASAGSAAGTAAGEMDGPALAGMEMRAAESGFQASPSAAAQCKRVRLAVVVDYGLVKALGSTAEVETRLHEIYAGVDALYRDPRLNFQVTISEILFVDESETTWEAPSNAADAFVAFQKWRLADGAGKLSKPYDAAVLWYSQPSDFGFQGMAALGRICDPVRNIHTVGLFRYNILGAVRTAAHELGHNLGADHATVKLSIMAPSADENSDVWDEASIKSILDLKVTGTCFSECLSDLSADFAIAGPSACSETRRFTDQSEGEAATWKWEFGDGSSSAERNPSHTYPAPGFYTPLLTLTNAEGRTSVFRQHLWVQRSEPAPAAKDARACGPISVTLEAQGKGTLRWYDTSVGGVPVAEGAVFRTPVLDRSKTYYVEAAEAAAPVEKVGLSVWPGLSDYFTANADRGLLFDVRRPARIVSVKVKAGAAGPRVIEILDAKRRTVASRTVSVPAGESRVPLGFDLQPGRDYVIKVAGKGAEVNLYAALYDAEFPYASPDSMVFIKTGFGSQSSAYFFFYDWDVQGLGCPSPRTPVLADLTCPNGLKPVPTPALHAQAMRTGTGRFRLEGAADQSSVLEFELRGLDGSLLGRWTRRVAPGSFVQEFAVNETSPGPWLATIRIGEWRRRQVIRE